MAMTQKELAAKLAAEVKAAEACREELEKKAGRPLSQSELLRLWLELNNGELFGEAWKHSQEDLNRWFASEKAGHEVTHEEAWEHYRENGPEGEPWHHRRS